MKKIFISFLLIAILLFSGCSCSKKAKLELDSKLNQLENYSRTYNVYLDANYSDGTNSYVYDDEDRYGIIDMKGTYQISVTKVSVDNLPDAVSKTFKSTLNNGKLYQIQTSLNIKSTYDKIEKSFDDYIITNSFCYGNTLTPVYSETKSKMSYLSLKNDVLEATEEENLDEIVYNTDRYTVNRKTINSEAPLDTKEYPYEVDTVVDNSYFLFALQFLNLENINDQKQISVITPSYGVEKKLAVKYFQTNERLTINETEYTNVKLESFQLQDDNSGCFGGNTGKAQVVCIANNKLIRYVTPLISYDSNFVSFGGLVFDLQA